mgnify:CR=1 FL=1
MVQICIIPENKSQTDEIVNFLLKGKYLLNTVIVDNCILAKIDSKNRTARLNKTVISGIIRSLQFSNLNNRLREMYRYNMPVLYAVPIVHMDPDQSEAIADYVTTF